MGGVALGELVHEGFTGLDGEVLVVMPLAVGVEVHFEGELDGVLGVVREGEGLLVVAGEEIGVAGDVGLDGGVAPWAADAARLAEFPEVVDGSEPELGIGVAEDVAVVGGIGFHAAEDEHAAPDAVIGDGFVVRGDGFHALEVGHVALAGG